MSTGAFQSKSVSSPTFPRFAGSGAVVSSRRIAQQSDADLRKALRASLAHLALAGLPRAEILEIVNEEVRDLFRREANP